MALRRYDGPTLTLVVNPSAGRGRAKRLLGWSPRYPTYREGLAACLASI